MRTTVHYFNGKPMLEEDFAKRMPCSLCKGGVDFDKKEYFKIDRMGCDYEEMSCTHCFTKYRKIRREPNRLLVGTDSDELLGRVQEQLDEVIAMFTAEEIKQRAEGHDKFSETGECPGHMWKNTYPVITEKGTFVFEGCVICRAGRFTLDNKRYEDSLANLVRWVCSGLLENKAKKQVIDKVEAKPDICFADLFEEYDDDKPKNFGFI